MMQCKRCIGGQVFTDWNGEEHCIHCGAEHDKNGSIIEGIRVRDIDTYRIPRFMVDIGERYGNKRVSTATR